MHLGGMQNSCGRVCNSIGHENMAGTRLHTHLSTQNGGMYANFRASKDGLRAASGTEAKANWYLVMLSGGFPPEPPRKNTHL